VCLEEYNEYQQAQEAEACPKGKRFAVLDPACVKEVNEEEREGDYTTQRYEIPCGEG